MHCRDSWHRWLRQSISKGYGHSEFFYFSNEYVGSGRKVLLLLMILNA
jgi:hypothetical protein